MLAAPGAESTRARAPATSQAVVAFSYQNEIWPDVSGQRSRPAQRAGQHSVGLAREAQRPKREGSDSSTQALTPSLFNARCKRELSRAAALR
jgi:hypothetical protein